MEEPDFEKYTREVNEMQNLPPASVELPPLTAMAIISHIQLASRHPGIADSEFTKIAIDVAKQLQNLFNEDSEIYKVLELGWNPEADILTPSGEGELDDKPCEKPCDEFLQNLGCPCTGFRVAEVVAGDEQISPQTLAAGAAIMHQLAQGLESEGFEICKAGDTCQG
jgi:hypothetical protein